MISSVTKLSSHFLVLLVLPLLSSSLPQSLDLQKRDLAEISSSSVPSSGIGNFGIFQEEPSSAIHPRTKRMIFDSSCKGVYNRELFSKLDRVCHDCYNLFRKPYIVSQCRKGCFSDKTYEFCVSSLGLDSKYFEYAKNLRSPNRVF